MTSKAKAAEGSENTFLPRPLAGLRMLRSRLPVIAVIFLNLSVYLLGGLSLSASWRQQHDRALIAARNIAALLDQNIAGQIRLIDQTLQDTVDEYGRQLATGRIDPKSMTAFLDRHRQRLSLLESLRITDAEGISIYGPDLQPGLKATAADRDYFMICRDQPDAGLVISKPVMGRITHQWLVILARRLTMPDGRFAGIVYAPLPVRHLAALIGSLNLGAHGVVSLRGRDFATLARFPGEFNGRQVVGMATISDTLQRLWAINPLEGTYEARAGVDHVERIFAYRQVTGYPVTVFVGLAARDFLDGWWPDAVRICLAMLLFTLVSAAGGWVLAVTWKGQAIARRQLEASNQDMEQFTEVLAHHLQEPVRLQYAFAQRLERLMHGPLSPDQQEALDYIRRGALRLKVLLRDVQLYLSLRAEGDILAPCSGDQALAAALDKLDLLITREGAEIRTTLLPNPRILPSRLSEVFVILITNALENRRSDVVPQVEIASRQEQQGTVFTVSDNGVGIAPEFRERVFRVFERLSPQANSSGTGIGLAIARKIIETAHGRIWIEESDSGGTRVCFTLPCESSFPSQGVVS